MATHMPSDLHPFGGELGWVAGDPDHSGKGLGRVVCSAVVKRYLDAGYKRIYLKTDDWRLPAIKTYLKIGFGPFLFDDTMEQRWKAVCDNLNWPFIPEQWQRVKSLPKILIIGDSISLGYTPHVARALDGIAAIEHNDGNAQCDNK